MGRPLLLEWFFERFPARMKVADVLFEHGFSVRDGRIYCNEIEIPFVEVARSAGVNRRIVYDTVSYIMENDALRFFFERVRCATDLFEVAPLMAMEGVEIVAPQGKLDDIAKRILQAGGKERIRLIEGKDIPGVGSVLRIAFEGTIPDSFLSVVRGTEGIENIVLYTFDPSRMNNLCDKCRVKYCPRYIIRKKRGEISIEL